MGHQNVRCTFMHLHTQTHLAAALWSAALLCAHVVMMCSGRRHRIGKEAGSLFLPTEVCQTEIFWELQSEKISPGNSRCIDSFFSFLPSKIAMPAVWAGERRQRAALEAAMGKKQEMDLSASLTEQWEITEIRITSCKVNSLTWNVLISCFLRDWPCRGKALRDR